MSGRLELQAQRVLERCREAGVRLAVAEACTGGLITASLTGVPGSSSVLERGLVPYSNEAKVELLGVSPQLLVAHGAVSAEVACAMAEGLLGCAPVQLALAETGIAGPGGATATKPVGLVFIALARRGRRTLVERHVLPGDRAAIREAAAALGLELVSQQFEAQNVP